MHAAVISGGLAVSLSVLPMDLAFSKTKWFKGPTFLSLKAESP